jgi:hypothetical protein
MTMISVHIKTPKDKKTVSIGDKASVKDVSISDDKNNSEKISGMFYDRIQREIITKT